MTTTPPATKSVTPATNPATKSAGAATPVKKVSVKKVVAAPVVVDVKEEAETDAQRVPSRHYWIPPPSCSLRFSRWAPPSLP